MATKSEPNSTRERILEAQESWAKNWFKNKNKFDTPRYLRSRTDNLFRTLNPLSFVEFEKGSGKELKQKMRALHSSSILVCNVFDYWRCNDPSLIAKACGLSGNFTCLSFERKFHTEISKGINAQPPNLDVVFTGPNEKLSAIESKFVEAYQKKVCSLKDKYLKPEGMWKKQKLNGCQEVARKIHKDKPKQYLDIPQLLKHILGLTYQLGKKNYTLTYLWYKIEGNESKEHENEIKSFYEDIKDEVDFRVLTYQELFHRLCSLIDTDSKHSQYLRYLRNRYFKESVR